MTERDRLIAVLEGRAPDRTPWYGDLSWWHSARLKREQLPPEHSAGDAGYLRMHRDAGVGVYLYAPLLWEQEYDATIEVITRVEGGVTTTTIVTPLGEIRSTAVELPGSGTSALVEHYVKRSEDLRVMQYLFTHRIVRPNYAAFDHYARLWSDWGLPCVLAPICTTALQMLLARWAGVETTVTLYCEARQEFERTLAVIHESDDAIFSLLCKGPGRYVIFPENLSGEVTGRHLLQSYALPYWRRRIAQLHEAGKRVGIHNDGTLRASLPLLVEAGFDFVEAVTPAPVGDMPLDEIRRTTEGRTTVWGCLPGALFSPLTPEEKFCAFVREVLRVFPPGSGFVLGVADQVPPDAEFSRICRVRELVDRFG